MTAGAGRTLTYTSFNIPATIAGGSTTLTFSYGPDHQRFQQVSPQGTTVYINGSGILAEKFTGTGGTWQWNDYLFAGGAMVGVHYEFSTGTTENRYFHKDNLGSVAALTDDSGAVAEQDSYDAWGKRRYPNGSDDTTDSITSQTTRGFTSQEELQDVALLHFNGRVYDPYVARFTSADPLVGAEFSTQGWNRYSYVGNNPLRYTDPTGMCFLGCFWKPIFHGIGSIVRAIARVPVLGPALEYYAAVELCGPGAGGCIAATTAAESATVTGISGGNLGDAIKAGVISYAEAGAFSEIGGATNGDFTDVNQFSELPMSGSYLLNGAGQTPMEWLGTPQFFENVAGHALVGGVASVAMGGKFGSGALSGGLSGAAAPVALNAGFAGGLVADSVVGGVASVAGGGKFANGAETAAFGYLFNTIGRNPVTGEPCLPGEEQCQETGFETGAAAAAGSGGGVEPEVFLKAAGQAAEEGIQNTFDELIGAIEKFFGGRPNVVINKAGDPILMQGDLKMRFDINNTQGDLPHFHLERQLPNGDWIDAGPQHRYYFKPANE